MATMRRWLAPSGLLAIIFPAGLLFLWWLATHNHPDGLIPPPDLIVRELADTAGLTGDHDEFSGSLWSNLAASAARVFGGFLLSAALALPLGLLIGQLQIVRRMLDSMFQVLRPIPVTAWQPLFLILFGWGSALPGWSSSSARSAGCASASAR